MVSDSSDEEVDHTIQRCNNNQGDYRNSRPSINQDNNVDPSVLISMENVRVTRSNTSSAEQRRSFISNIRILSLSTLLVDRSSYETNLISIILAMLTVSNIS